MKKVKIPGHLSPWIDCMDNQWCNTKLELLVLTSVACAVGPSVTMSSTDFSFQKPGFWEFIWIFSSRNHLKVNISHILPNKIPLNPAHQDLSKNTKGTFKFLRKSQLQFNLIFSEEIIQYSRTFAEQVQTSWNQAHAPLLVESFPKIPRTQSEASWFRGSHNYKTKQNKLLPSKIDNSLYIWFKSEIEQQGCSAIVLREDQLIMRTKRPTYAFLQSGRNDNHVGNVTWTTDDIDYFVPMTGIIFERRFLQYFCWWCCATIAIPISRVLHSGQKKVTQRSMQVSGFDIRTSQL
jgi:hypothetical protein